MGRTFNPGTLAQGMPRDHYQWAQSLDQILNGDVDMGTVAVGTGSIDATGTPANFKKGNSSGVLIRVGASGSANGPQYNWTASNTGVVINHGLMRQPIGFKVVDMDKDVRVYRTVVADSTQITLAPTDATANVTVYVF